MSTSPIRTFSSIDRVSLAPRKRDSAATSFTDVEDLASIQLHGNKLGKYWAAFKYLLRGFPKDKMPSDDVLEYMVWKQIKGCELIKNEITIYKQKTTKDKSKKSFKVLKTIIEDYLDRLKLERSDADHANWVKGLGGAGGGQQGVSSAQGVGR